MIATIRAAADIIRANADLLGRHGFNAAATITAIIRMANRLTDESGLPAYNPHGFAIRELATAVKRKADRIDAEENGIRTYVDTDGGLVVSIDGRPTANHDARLLDNLFHELYSIGLSA